MAKKKQVDAITVNTIVFVIKNGEIPRGSGVLVVRKINEATATVVNGCGTTFTVNMGMLIAQDHCAALHEKLKKENPSVPPYSYPYSYVRNDGAWGLATKDKIYRL